MLKKFQMWFYLKLLEFRFKKKEKWEISLDFLYAIVTGFKDEWLLVVNPNKLVEEMISMHFKSIEDFQNGVLIFIKNLNEKDSLRISHSTIESFSKEKFLKDFLTTKEKLPVDPYILQKQIKVSTLDIIKKLKEYQINEPLQFGYYQRNSQRIISDLLEIYWCFISISK